jgi:hypothetical protein
MQSGRHKCSRRGKLFVRVIFLWYSTSLNVWRFIQLQSEDGLDEQEHPMQLTITEDQDVGGKF